MGLYTDRGYNLVEAKQVMLMEIESWYGNATLDTFDSSVLGAPHRYYCSEADQLRFINGKVANVTCELMCGLIHADPSEAIEYVWVPHTSSECGKLQTEYVQFTKTASAARLTLIAQTGAATTVAAVDAIFDSLQTIL